MHNQALFTSVQTLISTHSYQSFTPCFAVARTLRLSLASLTLSRWRVPPLPPHSLVVVFVCFWAWSSFRSSCASALLLPDTRSMRGQAKLLLSSDTTLLLFWPVLKPALS